MSQEDRIIVLLGSDLVDGGGRASIQKPSPSDCRSVNIQGITVICTPDATQFSDKHVLDLMASIYPVPGTSHFYLMVEKGTQVGKWVNVFGKSVCENIQTLCKETRQLVENPLPSNDKTWQSLGQPYTSQHLVKEILSKRKDSLPGPSEISVDKYRGNPRLSLVLLGEKGSGKSASGNTILGEERFRSELSSMAITTECEGQYQKIYGTEVKVIDTPDFFDEDLQERNHVEVCSQMCDGVCVYLLVIQIGRFTEGERDILQRLEKALPITRDETIILFTYGDDLGSQNIDEYIRKTNKNLQVLISNCGNRYQVFNNKDKKGKKQQADELMRKIAELVNTTEGVQVFPDLTAQKKTGMWSSLGSSIGL